MNKIFDVMAPDTAGGVNVAELLAKQGIKTDDNNSAVIPNVEINKEVREEEPKPTEQKVETTDKPVVAEASAPELPKLDPVIKPVAEAEPTKPVEIDWKEVLKKQPEVEILKAVGLDEKMINFLTRWKGGEDLKDYLEAASTDYSKMSAEEIMRRYYQREFSSVSPEDFEEIYRMKVIEQFKLDSDVFDEKDVRRGKLMLNYEADKIRQQFAAKQQELLFSKPPEAQPSIEDQQAIAAEAEQQRATAEYKELIEKDAFTQELLNKKLMTVGDGEEAFNYEVSQPQSLLDVIFDPKKWASSLYDANGKPNVRKHMLLAAIASDDVSFLNNYAKHHQRLGAKRAIEPIENASPPSGLPSKGEELPSDPAAALAKAGIITSG